MAQAAYTEAQLIEALEAVTRTGNVSQAAEKLGLARGTMDARWRAAKVWAKRTGRAIPALTAGPMASRAIPTSDRTPVTSDEAWDVIDRWLGRSPRPTVVPATKKGATQRIVIAGDFHAPFHEPELVAEMLRREKGADLLIVNGDIQDFYAISRFTKYERVTVADEFAAVDALLGQFSRAFPRVLIVRGNHDKPRFEKQLRQCVSQDMVEAIELMAGTLDPVAVIAKRYPNIELAAHTVGRHTVSWFAQVGDLICSHAEKFSRVPGSTLRGVHEWFVDRHDTLGLEPWRVLVQAHTHQLGVFPWLSDQLLIEGGCMCQTHGYQLDAKVAGRPQRRGYVTLEQRHGVTDVNTVRTFWWDRSGVA